MQVRTIALLPIRWEGSALCGRLEAGARISKDNAQEAAGGFPVRGAGRLTRRGCEGLFVL